MKPMALLLLVLFIGYPGWATADNETNAASGASAASDTTANGMLINVELTDVSVRDAVAKLFQGRAEGYFLAPGVTGKISELKLKGITLEEGLKAIAGAAGLTYKVEDGIYVVEPASAVTATAQTGTTASNTAIPAPSTAGVPIPSQQPQPATQVVINSQPAPVYYGNPAPEPYYGGYGGYGYPQSYSIGAVDVLGGGGYNPVIVAGTGPQFIGWAMPPPPPPNWVSPDVLRFLRYRYILPSRPYAGPGYYGW